MDRQRIKDIFSREPEKMSRLVSRFFTIPAAYVLYILLSLLIPMNLGNVSNLCQYCLLCLSLFLCTKLIAKAPFSGFIYSTSKFSFKKFFLGFGVMSGTICLTYFVRYLINPASLVFAFDSSAFVFDWITNLLLVLAASFAEEYMFRGFIMHFVSDTPITNSKSKLIYALVSAVLFTGAHFQNPEVAGSSAIWSMSFYFMMGFALMLIAIKTGGIEAGWGIHFANNLLTAWVFGYSGSVISTNSIFLQTAATGPGLLIQGFVCMACCYLLV